MDDLRKAVAQATGVPTGPRSPHNDPSAALAAEQAPDTYRIVEWATSTPRKAAALAFTAGPERQAAYWIEWAEARERKSG